MEPDRQFLRHALTRPSEYAEPPEHDTGVQNLADAHVTLHEAKETYKILRMFTSHFMTSLTWKVGWSNTSAKRKRLERQQ